VAKTKILKKTLKNLIALIPGGVTAAAGFSAAGLHAGIKTNGAADLALLAADADCTAAGIFTTNAIRASSVDWCEKLLPSDRIRAVVATSGCANACTGLQGEKDTERTAELAGLSLRVPPEAVLVAATGMIGKFLPMETIADGLRQAEAHLSRSGGLQFARAVMTTDTVEKEAAARVKLMSGNVVIGGCVKGSGMICPNMATMLAFITTDAKITAGRLNAMVKRTVDRTFNNLTIDGDTSTNDMVLVLASGASGLSIATEPETQVFEEGLLTVCAELCKKIAADGEGATKRVEITVRGSASEAGAKRAAKAVANSNLVKCALFGNDPNWGRIACAIGYSGTAFSREKMTIAICGVTVFKNLQPVPFDEKKVSKLLSEKVVAIDINLGCGEKSAVAHTCDFSYDYVKINAEYHT
jgi:glutamate N-acetyltransferase/amino-acid N-acetyltransferase